MTSDTSVLRIRKHADKSGSRLADGAWPLAGMSFEDGPPDATTINVDKVNEGISEGWITAEGGVPVVRPAGPTPDVWVSTHTGSPHFFMHYERLVFHSREGDVAYAVTHQPDKYADHAHATHPDQVDAFDADDDTPVTEKVYAAGATRVDHFYGLEREG